MSLSWHCDICGKSTHVNPPSKQKMEQREVETEIPITETKKVKDKEGNVTEVHIATGKKQKIRTKAPFPVMRKFRRQNPSTGNVDIIDVPALEYLAPRTVLVSLKTGDENIQKDFCEDCYNSKVKLKVEALWKELELIKSK